MSLKKNLLFLLLILCYSTINAQSLDNTEVNEILSNARKANTALYRSHRFVEAWLTHCDSKTGLIPKNLQGDNYWNAQDAAADNYPFMVLTTFFTDKKLYSGTMIDMLKAEIKYTSRIGACPATYDLKKQNFKDSIVDVGNIIFGSSEYIKDGLLPLTEWLGESPWSKRMLSILKNLRKITGGVVKKIEGHYLGGMQEVEANGDLLQVLSRIYWMTGEKEYLEWAIEIGDYYLLQDENNPIKFPKLRLRDHGGEIVLGLCELYATLHFACPEKQQKYKPTLYSMLNRILECGRNEHGMFYDEINPNDCSVVTKHLADTWGYILDGFYTVYLIDGYVPYKEAAIKTLNNLYNYYRGYDWEYNSQDGYADAIESAINLYNREPIPSVAKWIDSEIWIMLDKQRPDGVVEGWHGDGNYARTAIMYALWKSQGCYLTNWNKDIFMAAKQTDKAVTIVIETEKEWSGKLCFDKQRHKTNMGMPIDWTRINQFPEWFAPEEKRSFKVSIGNGAEKKMKGKQLHSGISLSLNKGDRVVIKVKK